jgi:hypothetical protein
MRLTMTTSEHFEAGATLATTRKKTWLNNRRGGYAFGQIMRPITKILLLLVAAVAVYALWPRVPQLSKFDPAQIAALEVKAWVAAREGKSLGATTELYKVYDTQLKFSPIASVMIGRSEAEALTNLEKVSADRPDEERTVLPALQEKYAVIKRETKAAFNSDDVARTDLTWLAMMRHGATPDQIIPMIAESLAMVHGGAAADYVPAAEGLAWARVLVQGTHVPDNISDPKQAAEESATEGYRALKELLEAKPPEA